MDDLRIRPASRNDLEAINEIYNHYVLHSTCTYVIEPDSMSDRVAWFDSHGPQHPVIVAESAGQVVAWGSLSRFHPRPAYGHTVENSVYVRHDLQHRGLGRALLAELIARAGKLGHHSIIALISADQTPSVKLHESMGFVQVAHLKEVGFKFGRWLDVVYLQLML
jgi:L-amino acid N-acyltransferase YncA